MLKHNFQSGKSDGGDATLVRPSNWNEDHRVDTSAGTAALGYLVLRNDGGPRELLAISNVDQAMLPLATHPGFEYEGRLVPLHGSTTMGGYGFSTAITGTATAASWADTNAYTRTPKLESLVTAASATAVASRYNNGSSGARVGGSAAGQGGFHLMAHWGPATGVATATARAFCGMANSTGAPTDVEPSTITNIVGMGWDAADTNVQIMHRNAGAVTKIDLGASFPVPGADRTTMYRLELYSAPSTTQAVDYKVTNLTNGNTTSGTITTNLPSTATSLGWRAWCSVGGTSSVIGVAVGPTYLSVPIA